MNLTTNITLIRGSNILLKDTELNLVFGERYGICSPNGRGKSSLLSFIADKFAETNISMLHIKQEISISDQTVFNVILNSNKHRLQVIQRYAELENQEDLNLDEYQQVCDAIEEYAGDEARIRKILLGLGFDSNQQDSPTSNFSGGWRMRLALAQALYLQCDVLLLDESDNFLDLEAIVWLSNYLTTTYQLTRKGKQRVNLLVTVSHNIEFLNMVCTNIYHIHRQKLFLYRGNYNTFRELHRIQLNSEKKEWEKLEKQVRAMQRKSTPRHLIEEFVSKSGILRPEKEYSVRFSFPEVPLIEGNIIELDEVSFNYGDRLLLDKINLGIDMNTRICILGKNGAGKSTLIKILAGELDPSEGSRTHHYRLRFSYFSQHMIQSLPEDSTCVGYIQSLYPKLTIEGIRKLLGTFGLTGSIHTKEIRNLSGGQKVRLILLTIHLYTPHCLLLDEITSNLDIESIEAIIKGINRFNGGVVLISHDANLISQTNCILYELEKGELTETTYIDYCEKILLQ